MDHVTQLLPVSSPDDPVLPIRVSTLTRIVENALAQGAADAMSGQPRRSRRTAPTRPPGRHRMSVVRP